jgi:hypothetical protein
MRHKKKVKNVDSFPAAFKKDLRERKEQRQMLEKVKLLKAIESKVQQGKP